MERRKTPLGLVVPIRAPELQGANLPFSPIARKQCPTPVLDFVYSAGNISLETDFPRLHKKLIDSRLVGHGGLANLLGKFGAGADIRTRVENALIYLCSLSTPNFVGINLTKTIMPMVRKVESLEHLEIEVQKIREYNSTLTAQTGVDSLEPLRQAY